MSALLYDKLVIEEVARRCLPTLKAADLLYSQKAIEAGIENFVDKEALRHLFSPAWPSPDLDLARHHPATLRFDLCLGLQSFSDLREAAKNFLPLLEQKLNARVLSEVAPLSIRLANGRQTKVTKSTTSRTDRFVDFIPPPGFLLA